MKKSFKIAIASVALFTTATAFAMGPKPLMMMHHFDEEIAEQRLDVVDQLELSDSIKGSLKTLITEHDEQMQTLFEEHREKVTSIHTGFKSDVDGLLSDEEQEEFHNAMKQFMKEKFREARKHKKFRHHDRDES